jgi:hypothetical protein
MGNLLDFLVDCVDCHDEGVLFWGNSGGEYDTDFCDCSKGVSLENEYCEWYSESIMNENYKENK